MLLILLLLHLLRDCSQTGQLHITAAPVTPPYSLQLWLLLILLLFHLQLLLLLLLRLLLLLTLLLLMLLLLLPPLPARLGLLPN